MLVGDSLVGHSICFARSIAEAEANLRDKKFELMLIDVHLPDGNGFDLCLRLSQDLRHQRTPKILLTAADDISNKIYGFNCGADDYMTKPFNPVELKVRIERFFKHSHIPEGRFFSHPNFVFDREFQKCFLIEGEVKTDLGLSPTEFRLFLALVKNEGRVVSRQDLGQLGWEAQGASVNVRGIDTHMAHLRKKLGVLKNTISVVYGTGYSFKKSNKAS